MLFAFAGCVQQIARPVPVCPGKQSAEEALSTLNVRAEKAVSFRGNGQCLLKYTSENHKRVAQNFPVQVWVNPPHEIYLQGNVAVDGRAVVMGSNEDEFWLAIRPQEISSFYWGRWGEAGLIDELPVSPQIVLEAIGLVALNTHGDEQATWTLSGGGAYDVLTSRTGEGRVIKRIHIYNCDYLIRQIEYFDNEGDVLSVVKMGEYEKIAEECFVPKKIEITRRTGGSSGDLIKISFNSVWPAKFNDKVRQRIFIPPLRAGFKHVYKLENGVIEAQ
jgi:hypothetical protein